VINPKIISSLIKENELINIGGYKIANAIT
jgi:hypothetical protein